VARGRSKTGVKPAAAKYFDGGNYDNRFFEDDVNVRFVPDVQFVGIGVLNAKKSPAQIRASIAEARKARPLGFARLVILQRKPAQIGPAGDYTKAEVLYLSPRVWLHDVTSDKNDVASDKNYYLSRLLWSLRATPGYESHEVLWQVSHPVDIPDEKDKKTGQVTRKGDPFATNAFRAMRGVPLKDVWGPKPTRSNYATFLTMSNETSEGGPAVLLHRTKARPTDDGQDLVQEGNLSRYRKIVEYEYDDIKTVDRKKTKTRISFRELMATHPAGQHLLHKQFAASPFAPPAYFLPW